MVEINKMPTRNAGKGLEKKKSSLWVGLKTGANTLEIRVENPQKAKIESSI